MQVPGQQPGTGPDKHYLVVELKSPPGAKPAIRSIVAMASAAHECGAADHVAASVAGYDFFGSETVLRGENASIVEAMADWANRFLDLNSFGSNDAEIEIGQLGRIGRCFEFDCEFVASGNVQPLAIQGAGVLFAADEGPDLGHAREVRRVK